MTESESAHQGLDIKLCGELCRTSYSHKLPPGFVDIEDMRVGIRIHNGINYVVFRGSANKKNWLRNIRALPLGRSPSGYAAHIGFSGAFKTLLQKVAIPTGRVVFTGHSLGGALAMLFAEAYRAPCVTFGCPRVYARWSKGPRWMDHTRFVSKGDPVPLVPYLLCDHKHPEIGLEDDDGWIEIADHDIGLYIHRMGKQGIIS